MNAFDPYLERNLQTKYICKEKMVMLLVNEVFLILFYAELPACYPVRSQTSIWVIFQHPSIPCLH
ncbi:Protein of unknown function [Gryllus bimaculatus]|nr:Protein of unknown function [Gryllus bimaculatus]